MTDGWEQEDKGGPGRQENALLFRLGRLVSFASLGARRLGGPPLVPSGTTDRAKNLMRLIAAYFRPGEIEDVVVVVVSVLVRVFVLDVVFFDSSIRALGYRDARRAIDR